MITLYTLSAFYRENKQQKCMCHTSHTCWFSTQFLLVTCSWVCWNVQARGLRWFGCISTYLPVAFFYLLVADTKRVDFKNGNIFAITSVYPSSIFMYSNYFITPQSTHVFIIHRFCVSNALTHDYDTFYKELSNQQFNNFEGYFNYLINWRLKLRAFKIHCCDSNI